MTKKSKELEEIKKHVDLYLGARIADSRVVSYDVVDKEQGVIKVNLELDINALKLRVPMD